MLKTLPLVSLLLLGPLFSGQAQDTSFWKLDYAPSWRHMLSSQVINNDIYIGVGGWYSNDSISTVARTLDYGKTWQKRKDNLAPILQDVHFPVDSVGYAVGWDGGCWKSLDHGENWTEIIIPGQAGGRDFNACYFLNDSTGYIAGGNLSNDAIQTILMTSDGGASWSVQSDGLGPWLQDITFVSEDSGYAVGDGGTMLRTVDGGNQWSTLNLQGNLSSRNYTAISMLNNKLGLAVGGWPDNDSIQTLLRTTDGGDTWMVIRDQIGSMLYGVGFKTEAEAYVAGDDGTILTSTDSGKTWNPFVISGIENAEFRSVHFRSKDQGVISGLVGVMLMFNDTTNRFAGVTIGPNIHRNSETTAVLNGQVLPRGFATDLSVEYGWDGQFDQTGNIEPSTVSGTDPIDLEIELEGLTPSKLYEVRIKAENEFGVSYSNVVSFFSGGTPIPNYSFEDWEVITRNFLDDWNGNVGVRRTNSGDGSKAVEIASTESEAGLLFLGGVDGNGYVGGTPCPVVPDSIAFDINYHIESGDSALVFSYFKKDGIELFSRIFHVTGSSQGEFQKMSFMYDYSGSEIPDSVILAFVNTNAAKGNRSDTSIISIDNVRFVASEPIPIPNHDFEDWTDETYDVLSFWSSTDRDDDEPGQFLQKTTDAYRGDYALLLENEVGVNHGRVVTGEHLGQAADFPVERAYSSFIMHLKWFPQDGDTLIASVNMYSNGVNVGNALAEYTAEIQNYERQVIPFWYWDTAQVDSCQINFSIANQSAIPGNSYAVIDHLSFETFFSSTPQLAFEAPVIFPNPFTHSIHCEVNPQQEIQEILLLDLVGRTVIHKEVVASENHIQIDTREIPQGSYTLVIRSSNNTHSSIMVKL